MDKDSLLLGDRLAEGTATLTLLLATLPCSRLVLPAWRFSACVTPWPGGCRAADRAGVAGAVPAFREIRLHQRLRRGYDALPLIGQENPASPHTHPRYSQRKDE